MTAFGHGDTRAVQKARGVKSEVMRRASTTVRLRMNKVPPLLMVLGLALRPDTLCARTQGISINVAADGTCKAVGLHVSCSDIGTKLREAGTPLDTWTTFRVTDIVNFDEMKPAMASLARAGFKNMKIGFITEPER